MKEVLERLNKLVNTYDELTAIEIKEELMSLRDWVDGYHEASRPRIVVQ